MVSWGQGESQCREAGQHAEDRRQAHVTGVVTSGLFPSLGHFPDIALILLLGESMFSSAWDRWRLVQISKQVLQERWRRSKLEWGEVGAPIL